MYQQLDFFPKTAEESLYDLVNKLKAQNDKLRKGMYARIDPLEKKQEYFEEKLKFLEHKICNPDKAYDLVS